MRRPFILTLSRSESSGPRRTRSLRASRPKWHPLPAEGAPLDQASGARSLLAVTRTGLSRLAALPESVVRRGSRLPSQCSHPIARSPRPCPLDQPRSETSQSRSTSVGCWRSAFPITAHGCGTTSSQIRTLRWSPPPASSSAWRSVSAGKGWRPGGRRGRPQLPAWGVAELSRMCFKPFTQRRPPAPCLPPSASPGASPVLDSPPLPEEPLEEPVAWLLRSDFPPLYLGAGG